MVQDINSGKVETFATEGSVRRVEQTVQDLLGAVRDLGGRVGGLEYSNQQVVDLASQGPSGVMDFELPQLLADTISKAENNSLCIDRLTADLSSVMAQEPIPGPAGPQGVPGPGGPPRRPGRARAARGDRPPGR